MTKSILPNFPMVCLTAAANCSVSRTSALAGMQTFPVALDNSSADAFSRSKLLRGTQSNLVVLARYYIHFLLSAYNDSVCSMPHLIVFQSESSARIERQRRTTASVIPLQIPDPPPVQNSTLPSKMPSLKTLVEFTARVTCADVILVQC